MQGTWRDPASRLGVYLQPSWSLGLQKLRGYKGIEWSEKRNVGERHVEDVCRWRSERAVICLTITSCGTTKELVILERYSIAPV
jgi:hypothetical protein